MQMTLELLLKMMDEELDLGLEFRVWGLAINGMPQYVTFQNNWTPI